MKRIESLCAGLLSVLIMVSLSSCDSDLFDQDPVDLTFPSIIIQSPTIESGYSTTLADLSFAGIAEDNDLLKSVQWNINNGTKYDANGTNNWSTGNIGIQPGDNIFVAYAGDAAGNLSTDTLIITKNKYLTFLGEPLVNPLGVFANQPTSVNISIRIASNDNLIRNSVELIQVDADNNEIATICPLYDNGNLSNGDEINGDNVFSAISVFTLSSSVRLRVKAKSSETEGIMDGFSATIVLNVFQPLDAVSKSEVKNTLENSFTKLNELIKNNDYNTTLNKTVDWLETLPGVQSAALKDGGIDILFTSGLSGGIIISRVEPDGNRTRGGQSSQEIRKSVAKIPVSQQTRGDYKLIQNPAIASKSSDDLILDKDVLIYEPFEAIFDPDDEGDNIKHELEKSIFDFNIVHLKNQDCTIEALDNLTDYGYVYIATHGESGSTWFLTGQIVDPDDDYDLLLREGKIKECQLVDYKDNIFGKVTGTATIYAVSPKFIKALEGKFPNSIVFGAFCFSSETNLFSDAFISKGAKTYLGYDESVWSEYAKDAGIEYTTKIVTDDYTSGKAFDELTIKQDPNAPNANIGIKGSKTMYFSNSLINGDFEYSDLTGWTREGDGRVIVQLGSVQPHQGNYMGIISTGLGYTTNSGQISQSFKVNSGFTKIKMNWNFLSEEFMEWVGSPFQDFLIVKIKEGDIETVVFTKRIDTFASEYSLIPVSPGIVFDVGGVYMTGWKELSINISSYQNKNITLIIEVGDVGDSIFDSALLIDNITLE